MLRLALRKGTVCGTHIISKFFDVVSRYIFDVVWRYILFADFLDKALSLILVSKKENISIVEKLIEENKGWSYVLFSSFLLLFTA